MQVPHGQLPAAHPAADSQMKLAACSGLCAVTVTAAVTLGFAALLQTPRQPDFGQQLRSMGGVSTLNVERDELTAGDVIQLANAAAAQRRQTLRKELNGNAATAHLVATAHHQVRSGL